MSLDNILIIASISVNLIISLCYCFVILKGKSATKKKYLLDILKSIPAYVASAKVSYSDLPVTVIASIVTNQIANDFKNLTARQLTKVEKEVKEEVYA